MDVETSHAIVSLRGDIREVETGLRGEIQQVETSLRGEIQQVETSLRGEIQQVETSLRAEIRRIDDSLVRVETTLRAEIGNLREQMFTKFDDQRRHTDIRFESLQDDIRLVAEGFAALSAKLDSLSPPS